MPPSLNPPSPEEAVKALRRPLGRIVLGVLLTGVLALAGTAYFVKSRFVNDALRHRLETELTRALDVPVTVGSIGAAWSGDLVFSGIAFRLPSPPHEYDVYLDRVEVNLRVTDLILGKIKLEEAVESVAVARPRVTWLREARPSPPSSDSSGSVTPGTLPVLPVARLSVRDGVLAVKVDDQESEVVRNLKIRLDRLPMLGRPGNRVVAGCSCRVLIEASAPVSLRSALQVPQLQFLGLLHLKDPQDLLEGKLSLRNWPLGKTNPLLPRPGPRLEDGTLDLDSPFRWSPGRRPEFDARVRIASVTGSMPGDLKAGFSKANGILRVTPGGLTVEPGFSFETGGTAWSAEGSYPFTNDPVRLDLSTDRLDLGSMLKTLMNNPKLDSDGQGTARFRLEGIAPNILASGDVEVAGARLMGWEMQNLAVKARYDAGVLRLERMDARVYGGALAGAGYVDLSPGGTRSLSLQLSLADLQAEPVGRALGIEGLRGKGDLDVRVSGTMEVPTVSLRSTIVLERGSGRETVRDEVVTKGDLKQGRLDLESVFNRKTRLACRLRDSGDSWDIADLSYSGTRKSGRVKGAGTWPKNLEGPLRLDVKGTEIVLELLPFFKDRFPRFTGAVDFDLAVQGTRRAPRAELKARSPSVEIGTGGPRPFELAVSWMPDSLMFEKLTLGSTLMVRGTAGLKPGRALDLSIDAEEMPVGLLAGFLGGRDLPDPLAGNLSGQIHLGGTRDKPLAVGEGILTGLRWGFFAADRVEASLDTDAGRIRVKRLLVHRGSQSLKASGLLRFDGPRPVFTANLESREFEVSRGLTVGGVIEAVFTATRDGWKEWKGNLASGQLTWKDPGGTKRSFRNVTLETNYAEGILRGNASMADALKVRFSLEAGATTPNAWVSLRLGPASIATLPEMTQFLPENFKVEGTVSGDLELKTDPRQGLLLVGNLQIARGSLQGYTFERLSLGLKGTPARLAPKLGLERGTAVYELSGTIESPGSFLGSDARLSLNGPIAKERWANLLSLIGVSTAGHVVDGEVSGNLAVTGTMARPVLQFALKGRNIVFDQFRSPSSSLQISMTEGKVRFGESTLEMEKGRIRILEGIVELDPADPSIVRLGLKGETDSLALSFLRISRRVSLDGLLNLDSRKPRPTFEGEVSFLAPAPSARDGVVAEPLAVKLRVKDKRLTLTPVEGRSARLSGAVDLSQPDRILVSDLAFTAPDASFQASGVLNFKGVSDLTADARNVHMEEVGKWLMPDFPLSGTGSFHLLFKGTTDSPTVNASVRVAGGRWGVLPFDLLDGTISIRDDTLTLGTRELPLSLSQQGRYELTAFGKVPFAMTSGARSRTRNREIDVDVAMPRGDFGIFLLAGFAKEASGPLEFSLHLSGTVDDPVVTADLDFNGCRMVPKMIAREITDLRGRIKVRNNKMVVEDLNAQIGQGRIFFWTPPLEESRMVLDGFVPQYLDLRVRTVTERGVLLNIPAIMRPNEWGEIHFRGSRPEDPLLIQGPISEPRVIGTALLARGHYTFPPIVARDESGKEITYKELANVVFELTLEAGMDCWYSNDFSTSYLELKVDPGDKIIIEGKDAAKTPQRPGIQSRGSAGSKQGYLRYLSHEFRVQQASLYIPKGEAPLMQGRAKDRITNVEIVTPAGTRREDVDFWVDFEGPFGGIVFKLDSNPKLDNSNDEQTHQQRLLSYILFGRDMTGMGYGREELRAQYEKQNVGGATGDAVLEALDRIASAELTRSVRRLTQRVGGLDINVKTGAIKETMKSRPEATPGVGLSEPQSVLVDAEGNTAPMRSTSLASVEVRKYLDDRLGLAAVGVVGVGRQDITEKTTIQKQVGLDYEVTRDLTLNTRVGENQEGLSERSVGLQFRTTLPDVKRAKKGDVTPPKIERFDLYVLGPDKVQLLWTTDEVTRGEIRLKVLDDEESSEQVVPEKGRGYEYRHEMVLERLDPEAEYELTLVVRDLNGNQTVSPSKRFSTTAVEGD